MKNLPDIGSNVLLKLDSKKQVVTIIAHFRDKAVYIYKTDNNFSRVDMATAYNFEEIPALNKIQINPIKTGCNPGEHNYVQLHEAHQNKVFCTRCGNTINLE